MAEIQGSWNPQFDAVASTLAASLDAGTDVGASVTVMVEGEPVVDIWGGWVDEAHSAPWAEDTITNVWSTTKTMTFLSALMLADRGELDFHAPVATYWPEFATAGKEAVEVRHLMSHTAGLPGWQEPMVPEDLADWDKCVSYLAAQEPWWEPGTVSGYHAVTQGYLIGEVVRRITGQSMGTFFAKEIAEPLGADFFIGLPESEESRVSLVIPPPPLDLENLNPPPMAVRALTNPFLDASYPHERWWRAAEIPAANGQGNARSVARIQSIIAGGGEARGIRLLSEAGVERLFDEQIKGQDLVLGNLYRFGLGYGLSSDMMPIGPRACFWGGYGGSLIIMDLDTRLTVCYVMNRMEQGLEGDVRGFNLVMAAVLGLAGG
jgi:CubicO group peptidase (beta-lactamase class C family)